MGLKFSNMPSADKDAIEAAIGIIENTLFVTDMSNSQQIADNHLTIGATDVSFTKSGISDYFVTAKIKYEGIHVTNEDVNLIAINNGINDIIKVVLKNRPLTIGIGVPVVNSEIEIITESETKSINVTDIVNQLGGDDIFSIRRVDPNITAYNWKSGGIYDQTTELTNYTLPEQDLGWVAKITSTGLELIRYDYTLISNVLTIGATPQETISVAFNANEKLDDFIKRLSTEIGTSFEVFQSLQNINLLCTDLIPCEIQMCRWFKPIKYNRRRYDIAADLLSTYIVDCFPAQFQLKNKDYFDLTLSYTNQNGWRYHEVFINDFMIIQSKKSTAPSLNSSNTVLIYTDVINNLSQITFDSAKYYQSTPVLNLTGHNLIDLPEYASASLAASELGYRTTTGRTKRVMDYLNNLGFKHITISDFLKMKSGVNAWEKSYFFTWDDSASILAANTMNVNRKLKQMGMNITAGINTNSYYPDDAVYEVPITASDVNFFKQYGELFNHSHTHRSHEDSSIMQIINDLNSFEAEIKNNSIYPERLFALPYNEGSYAIARLIKSRGYIGITAYYRSYNYGATFKGNNNCSLPRIEIEDLASWDNVLIRLKRIGMSIYEYNK